MDAWVEEGVLSGCTTLELNDSDATKDVVAEFANTSQALALHAKDERTVVLTFGGTCNSVQLTPVTH
jgi:hypothetical protein